MVQSHYLASNAVYDGVTKRITSIPDESGLENLVQYSSDATALYEETGWGADNGPAFRTPAINTVAMKADGWGARISGVRTPFTVISVMQLASFANYETAWGFTYNGTYIPGHLAARPRSPRSSVSGWNILRYENGWYIFGSGTVPIDTNRHIIIQTFSDRAPGKHGLNIDGTELVPATDDTCGTGSYTFNEFRIGGWGTTGDRCQVRFAELHLYAGVLTSEQKTAIIADIHARRG